MYRFSLLIVALIWLVPNVSCAKAPLLVIVPGGKGAPHKQGFLMRNLNSFKSAGFQVKIASSPRQAVKAMKNGRKNNQKIYLVGMSIGAIKAAAVLGTGARPNAVVLFSANYQKVQSKLKSPNNLPPVLAVHHVTDKCKGTSPNRVEPFKNWAGRKVNVKWIRTKGKERGNMCGPFGAHGFYMKDQEPISAALSFLKKH